MPPVYLIDPSTLRGFGPFEDVESANAALEDEIDAISSLMAVLVTIDEAGLVTEVKALEE